MRDHNYPYPVRVVWGPGIDTVDAWDEIAIWVIETFGLPGSEYITDLTPDHMSWNFRSDRDAFLMRLRFSEVITGGELV